MAGKTAIEWATDTWNPIVGCSLVSAGCTNCYAMSWAGKMLDGSPNAPHYAGTTQSVKGKKVWTGKVQRAPATTWEQPLRWTKPRKIFVNSMGDIFHEAVPDGWRMDVWRIMSQCPQHTFMILTKRPEIMRDWVARFADVAGDDEPRLASGPAAIRQAHTSGRAHLFADMIESWGKPPAGAAYPAYDWMGGMSWLPDALPNVWLGTSVEDRKSLHRIDTLRSIPAAIRMLSIEPLLEGLGTIDLTGIHWVIVGGESGTGARPMHPDWVRSIRDQCAAAGVAFFFKQWGSFEVVYDRDADDPDWRLPSSIEQRNPKGRWLNLAGGHGFHGERVVYVVPRDKSKTGRELDGREHLDWPAIERRAAA